MKFEKRNLIYGQSAKQGIRFFVICGLILNLISCINVPSIQDRIKRSNELAGAKGWIVADVVGQQFNIRTYSPKSSYADHITVYIEGDGFAWLTSSTPSLNPTPMNPVGLKLALTQPNGVAAYIARPCQFFREDDLRGCSQKYWTNKRFSNEVIEDVDKALSVLKLTFKASKLTLVGYSGGATIAAILSAKRTDVVQLMTVAGNLDHKAWTRYHKMSPLSGSLNALNYREQLASIDQVHYVGKDDKVIPVFLTQDFINLYKATTKARVIVVPNQRHGCCWGDVWGDLLRDRLKK